MKRKYKDVSVPLNKIDSFPDRIQQIVDSRGFTNPRLYEWFRQIFSIQGPSIFSNEFIKKCSEITFRLSDGSDTDLWEQLLDDQKRFVIRMEAQRKIEEASKRLNAAGGIFNTKHCAEVANLPEDIYRKQFHDFFKPSYELERWLYEDVPEEEEVDS